MNIVKPLLLLGILGGYGLSPIVAHAQQEKLLSLNETVALALISDPELQSSLATKDAGVEAKWASIAPLLPNISLTYQRNPNAKTDTQGANPLNPSQWSTSQYSSSSQVVQIRQTLFRTRQFIGLAQGLKQEDLALLNYQQAFSQAVLRALGSYSSWLNDESQLKYAQQATEALELRERMYEKMYQKGLASLTDVAKAREEKQQDQLERSTAKQQNEFNKQAFYGLIKQKNNRPMNLTKTPGPNTLLFKKNFERLLDPALSQNYEIRAAEKALEIASLEVKKNLLDHSPTVDFLAQHSKSDSFSDVSVGRKYETTTMGVVVTIPISQGGAVLSATRQADANYRKSLADLQTTKNRINREFHKAYEALSTAKDRWELAKNAIKATELELDSIIKQEITGLKSKVDVALAKRNYAEAKRDETKAKTEWILAKAELLSLKGEIESIIGQEYTSLFSSNP